MAKPHSLDRLLSTLWNTPHFVTPRALNSVVEYLKTRSNSDIVIMNMRDSSVNAGMDGEDEDEGELPCEIGEIMIDGAITYKPIIGACGEVTGTSYCGILEQAENLIESGVTTLVTIHSSPGGMAQHCFTTANQLRQLCDDNNVRWISYIDLESCSASLALGVSADEVIIHPDAVTGSIGCCVTLMDTSVAMDKMGLKKIYITSAPGKIPFNTDGSFTEKFLTDIQDRVNTCGDAFATHVAEYTGISFAAVKEMDAKIFSAQEALQVGLVNKIMDHQQFAAYLAASQTGACNVEQMA